jgi:hypothetical protein
VDETTHPARLTAGCQPAESDETVQEEEELAAELKDFIDRVIVPLLVERMMAENGHLYSATPPRYDTEEPLAQAA